MWNVTEYLREHSAKEIKVGQSGASVYEIDGKYVLKHVVRQNLQEEQFVAYTREARFYQDQTARERDYLPRILKAEVSESEILILMKKYDRPDRNAINKAMIQRITEALAALHIDGIPVFMRGNEEKAKPLSGDMIEACLSGWKGVLAEHPGAFREQPLNEIAGKMNDLIMWHDSEERVVAHGDFHWDNLLQDRDGRILMCDWQGVHLGSASGDLNFFLSRLGGDGVRLDAEVFLDAYVTAVGERTGKQIGRQDIVRHMNAAGVITSFAFWHEYLHGSSEERVRGIYDKMIGDFEACQPS